MAESGSFETDPESGASDKNKEKLAPEWGNGQSASTAFSAAQKKA